MNETEILHTNGEQVISEKAPRPYYDEYDTAIRDWFAEYENIHRRMNKRNRAAEQQLRVHLIALDKLGREFRRVSLEDLKQEG